MASSLMYKIAVAAEAQTSARSRVTAGRHSFVIDEPIERHGTDKGATPLEVLLGALAGCTNVIASRVASQLALSLAIESVEILAQLDGSVLAGHDVPAVFPKVRMEVKVRTDASPDQLNNLRAAVARQCPVAVLFRQAGSELDDVWTIVS